MEKIFISLFLVFNNLMNLFDSYMCDNLGLYSNLIIFCNINLMLILWLFFFSFLF